MDTFLIAPRDARQRRLLSLKNPYPKTYAHVREGRPSPKFRLMRFPEKRDAAQRPPPPRYLSHETHEVDGVWETREEAAAPSPDEPGSVGPSFLLPLGVSEDDVVKATPGPYFVGA